MDIIAYRIICANAAEKAAKEKRISKEILSKKPITEVVLEEEQKEHTGDPYDDTYRTQTGMLSLDVFVMKLKDYTLDEMINKDLLILFPFYLFRFDQGMLKKYNQDPVLLESIVNDYARIRAHLTQKVASGELDEYYRRTLIELCRIAAENLARHYKNIVKGVQSVMGGKAIETEAWTILNKGKQEGIAEGIAVGRQEERVNTERERRRAEAAERRANSLQEQLNALLRKQSDSGEGVVRQNGLKPAQQ